MSPAPSFPPSRLPRWAAGALALALATTGLLAAPSAPPAQAAGASVSAHVAGRDDLVGVADPTYLTELQLTGSGFQSIVNGFGGIYVLFGWVDGGEGWKPSNGGTTGTDYRYVPDDETSPAGYASFVTFPGSSTAYAANGGELAADGTWSTTLRVPGAKFTSLDRHGNATEVDCQQVQCGVITVGAHGVANANNETFTPIAFTDLYGGNPADAEVAVPAAPAAAKTATPAPTTTSYVTQPAVAAADSTAQLIPIIMGVIIGVGVLVLASLAFLVWAVVSGRKRQAALLAATNPVASAPAEEK